MIRRTLEPGKTVWNEKVGFGKFIGIKIMDADTAIVEIESHRFYIPRKELTEIESGVKNEQS